MPLSSAISSIYRFGVFELDGRTGELRKDGVKLKLQDQLYQVLHKLLRHPGEIVSRDELRSALWSDDTFVDFDTGLNTTIKRLRETLGDSADNPIFIETVPRRGYRFIAPVSESGSVTVSSPQRIEVVPKSKVKVSFRWGLAVALTGLLVAFSFKRVSVSGEPPEKMLTFAQLTSDGQAKLGPLLPDGSRIYFSEVLPSGWVLAQVSARGGQTISIPTSLSDPRPVDISPDRTELLVLSVKGPMAKELQGMELWIVPVAGGSARPVGNVLARDAAWGADGETILYSDGHEIRLVNKDGSNRRTLLSVSGYPEHFRWSPDRQRLRFTMTDHHIGVSASLWEAAANGSGLHRLLPELKYPSACCGDWTGRGEDFVYQSSSAGRTDLWELTGGHNLFETGHRPVRLTAGPMNFSQAAGSLSRGEVFAIGSLPRSELVKYEPQSGEFAPYISGISAEGVDSTQDGQQVAYTSFPDGALWRCNSAGGGRLQLTFPPMRALMPRWSPDGKQIAFIGNVEGNHWTNYLISAEGGVAQQLVSGDEQFADPTWTPDGKSIVFGTWKDSESRGIYVLDLSTKELSAVPDSKELWSPRISRDGRYIAAMTRSESKMMLFDKTTRKWEEIANLYSGYPSWSHDGRFLYFQDWSDNAGLPARIVRVRISDRKLETVLDLKRVDRLPIGSLVSWTGLAPDGSVLLARDISAQEIYSLKW
jgi:Tol biopolymer transport system component/DNA-binding winged helix-turn-helix (wHTH) protein